jgi:hypothetical protein
MPSTVRFDRWQSPTGVQFNNIVQVQFISWTSTTNMTTLQAYQPIPNGSLTITSTYPNTRFLCVPIVQGYTSGAGGANIGLNRTIAGNTVRVAGLDGAAGDTWLGTSNGFGTNSYNMYRHPMDTPNVAAGTPITYTALYGLWSAGTIWTNYPGYVGTSSLTVFEIQT